MKSVCYLGDVIVDIKVINLLNLQFLKEAAQSCGHAADMGEEVKHSRNDEACALRASHWL